MRRIGKCYLSFWLYLMLFISGVIVGVTICQWQQWSLQQKLLAAATALLPLHVLEEWHLPGGFHTMYNLMAESPQPDRYPMNQMSDMLTNLIGVIFGVIVLLVGANPFFCVMQLFLCAAEMFGHFSGGLFLYRRFRRVGKRTLYSPGMATAVFGYFPIAVGIIVSFMTERAPTLPEFILALLCGVALGALSLKLPERLLMDEQTPYAYTWGDGYLTKYLSEEKQHVSHQP